MQQTANYQLNQWDAEDRILRTDFNADNAKIDAAIKAAADASPYVKLLDVTTTTAAQQIDLDVSGINSADFHNLRIYLDFAENTPANGSVFFRVNNLSASGTYVMGSDTNRNYLGYFHAGLSPSGTTVAGMDLYCLSGGVWGVPFGCYWQYATTTGKQDWSNPFGTTAVNRNTLQTLNFLFTDTSLTLPAGTRIEVWGVRA